VHKVCLHVRCYVSCVIMMYIFISVSLANKISIQNIGSMSNYIAPERNRGMSLGNTIRDMVAIQSMSDTVYSQYSH